MNVYLAAAMTKPDNDLGVIAGLLACLEAEGHVVPTRHVARPHAREADACASDRALAERDLAWLRASDALVAEVTAPSHGVGIEVATAAQIALPTLVLFREGRPVSRLLTGLDGIESASYRDLDGACRTLRSFLVRVAARREPRNA
jgi:nucleoside 2-deoxyribosyltransferase